ncbi:hypothetical protein SAMN05444008_101124 [Cnuella takakiae]|uniref:Uncharacterized protein n=1 Tax=Cnuella takakiae TaxID=1302690 RepID=A0A1M4SHB3_9BACT|nr:hypothetical protein [Cnuella takakiae]OLY94506.1 hypothetical protein BUE76_23505 [Cnuella takakiae]SHE31538.1 hypothetical protein SAMN05444008_101124 [Cnuella takakiae]
MKGAKTSIFKRTGLWREALRSGTFAAIAMIPFGVLFSKLGLRINEYGQKIIQMAFPHFSKGIRFALFVLEHFVLSWIIAMPLLLLLKYFHHRIHHLLLGFIYGLLFYIAINSLLLPALFKDATPGKSVSIKLFFQVFSCIPCPVFL